MKYKNILLVVFFLTLFVFQQVQAGATIPSAENPSQINAVPANANILFSTFHVYVYKLVPPTETNSGSILPSHELCVYPADINLHTYGCGSEYPDLGIQEPQGYFQVGEEYYLKNVLPNEMDFAEIPPDKEALKAQAIAARTVASWKSVWGWWNESGSINNSTGYQVFIPGTYNAYPNYQADIDVALNATQGQFLSAGDGHAIDAEFSSDMAGSSGDGGQTYLIPIQDPISTCDLKPYGNGWGMSQRGAIRWAKGNVCPDGTGAAWPVKWNHQQILVHYYTGVDIVDDATGGKVAPDDRWNLLNYNLPNTTAIAGTNFTVNVTLQNTSTTDWTTDRFCLSFYARRRISPPRAG